MNVIKSIVKIKNCPSFVDFKPEIDLPEFSKYNLFYGWNGSGKTSFSRILRSFEIGEGFFNNPEKPAEFGFKLDNGTTIGHDNLSNFKHIRVFNKDFIDNTVFCDNGPKPIFFLGKESKEDKEKINKAEIDLELLKNDSKAKEILFNRATENKSKALTNKARDIKNALTTSRNDSYRNYEKPNLEESIKNNLGKLSKAESLKLSEERIVAIKKSIVQTSQMKIDILSLPSFDILNLEKEISDILKKKIVSKIIKKLEKDEVVSKWVEKGLEIHKDKVLDVCAFCNQKIPQARVKDLENHFNDEYQKTLRTVQDLKNMCNFRRVSFVFPESSNFYDDLATEYVSEKKKAENAISEFHKVLDFMISILEQKEQNIFSQPILNKTASINTAPFLKINEIIKRHNQKTENFESQVDKDKQDMELHYIAEFISTYNEILVECDSSQKDSLDLLTAVRKKEDDIIKLKENLLSHHIPAQQINKDLEQFLGRNDIQLKATDAQDGYLIIRNSEIARNLSEGEKTALSIVYFITKIKEDGFDLKNSVVVIDDPVSSLDSNAIFQAFSFIRESIKEARQIFILTHHFDYFRQVKNWFSHCKKTDRAYFMTVCKIESNIRKSSIVVIDKLLIDFESEYHFLFSVLYNFSEKKQRALEELYPMPNVARKFLESFLAFRVPFGSKVTNIYTRLEHIDFDPKKKERIRSFVETHSHPRYESGVQDFDMSILSETPDIIGELLELVKTEDPKHFNFLVQSISNTA